MVTTFLFQPCRWHAPFKTNKMKVCPKTQKVIKADMVYPNERECITCHHYSGIRHACIYPKTVKDELLEYMQKQK